MDTSIRTVLPPKPRKLHEKADEVRRRKEAAERLIKERHEAVRRQREERIMKINEERLRQQRELKERHAKELKRQQDVLQRRMALMERDNARKKEILEKNHAAASRLVNAPSRKKYAFGSSTPRELSFVECKQPKNQEKHQLREKQTVQNRSPSSTKHPNDAPMVMHAFSEQSDATVAVGARNSGTLDIENLPNANTSKISDVNTHVEVGVNVVSLNDDVVPQETPMSLNPSDDEDASVTVSEFGNSVQPPALQSPAIVEHNVEGFASPIHIPSTEQQAKAPLSEETPGNFHCENKIAEFLPENKVEEQVMEPKNRETAGNLHCESRVTEFLPEAEVEKQDKQAHSKEATGKSPCDNRIIEFPLEDEVQKQDKEVLNREAAISSHCADRTVDFMLEDEFTKQTKELLTEEIPEKLYRENRTMEFPGESESNIVLADKPAETRQPVIENRYNVSITNYGIEAYSDGLQNQSAPVISGDIPGTVPIIKEVDDSMTRKLPSPPNEFVVSLYSYG
uniref:INCENP_ARK-bind domain-containing protein n=1 Tax=Angiostrongylus cantonensis TaxID=6313 RepID=A0A158P8K6_ANGCA